MFYKKSLIYIIFFGLLKGVYAAEFNFGVSRSPAKQNFIIMLLLIFLVIVTFYLIYKITKGNKGLVRRKNS